MKKFKAHFAWILLAQAGLTVIVPTSRARGDEAFLKPVDEIREEIHKKFSSKQAKTLARASQFLEKKRYTEAIRAAESVKKSELFSDSALALIGQALREQSHNALEKKRYSQAGSFASKARTVYLELQSEHPYSPTLHKINEYLAETELLLGEASFHQRKKTVALKHFEAAFQKLIGTPISWSAANAEVLSHYSELCRNSQDLLCRPWLYRFSRHFSQGSAELQSIQAVFPEILDETAPRFRGFERLTQSYHSPDADQAAFDKIMTLYWGEKFRDAAREFQTFLDEFPKSALRFRARFWMARAFRRMKDEGQSTKEYQALLKESPLSYYGLMSAIALGTSPDTAIEADLPQATTDDTSLFPSEAMHVHRAERLVAAGATALATEELREIHPRDGLSSPYLMYLALLNHEAKNYLSSFSILGELIQRGYSGAVSSYALRLIFPVSHIDLIEKYAKANHLDPLLVLSLMKQESAFDEQAVSVSGALGLMQLMPTTALDVDSVIEQKSLVTGEPNIRVGCKYIKQLLDHFNGNWAYAVASYNAGPAAVQRWIRDGRAKEGLIEFIEQIPYKETREYVAGIIRNYYWYAKKLRGDVPPVIELFWGVYGPQELKRQEMQRTQAPAEPPQLRAPSEPPQLRAPSEPAPTLSQRPTQPAPSESVQIHSSPNN